MHLMALVPMPVLELELGLLTLLFLLFLPLLDRTPRQLHCSLPLLPNPPTQIPLHC
eukprot:COSAG02_NODE_68427_length_245_cov_10.643836_1_plen_55_part_10